MTIQTFRYCLLFLPFTLWLILIIGCENSPTDDDPTQQNDTTDVNDTTGSGLANRNSEFHLIDSINYADPGRSDSRTELVVRVRTNPRDYAGKPNVHLYEMPVGFVTDRVFHGNVVRESGRDLSIYYIDNMQMGSTLWRFSGWLPYPLSDGQRAVVLQDSTNSSGTIRQIATWSAQRNGVKAVKVKNRTFQGDVIDWEMEVTRTNADGDVELLVRYSGQDVFVEELKFPAERFILAEIDHEEFFSSKSWVVDYTLK